MAPTLSAMTLCTLLPGLGAAVGAQDLRSILPAECVVTVDVPDPVAAWRALTEALGALPTDLPPEVQGLAGAGLLFVRSRLGASPEEFVGQLAGGGAAFGLLREGSRWLPLLVLRPGDRARATEFLAQFAGRVHCEAAGDLLLVSKAAAGCERFRAGGADLPGRADGSRGQRPGLLHADVDLAALWRLIPGPNVDTFDAGGRLLLAPIASVLSLATQLQLDLTATDSVQITARLDASVAGTPWAGLLAAAGEARAVAPLPAGSILRVALDRSLTALLREPERFLSEAGQLDVQSFLSIADLLDGATTSFVDDLLGGLAEPLVLSVLAAPAADAGRCPLQLPGIALSAAVAGPEVAVILRRAAGVLTTILNGERAQNRKRAFLVRNARSDHGVGLVAEPPLWRGPGLPPIEDALSPTLLFGHGHVVLATTLDTAEAVLAALAAEGHESVRGDRITLCGATLAELIDANRSPLELGRVLDEAETEQQAARFFDIARAIAAAIELVELGADYGTEATTLTLRLERRHE